MKNFVAYNPTQLHFGNGVVKELGAVAASMGKKAMLVYGKGSVLKNGSYDATVAQLKANNIEIVEYNGIKPNPIDSSVDEAAVLGRKENVDMIVAVGGGSVIDSAKVLGICIADDEKAWNVVSVKRKPMKTLPLIAVLTLAATGTEMNGSAVLQNHDTNMKIGFRHPLMYPKHSFLDPSYTLSVPANYTAYGVADLIAHSLEAWFGEGDASLSDKIVVSIIKEAIENGPALLNDLQNYELRENIMWAATVALNGTTLHGRTAGDWGVHALGHILSLMYDTPHGATLSIIYPAWMRQLAKTAPKRVVELGAALFGTNTAEDTAIAFEKLFQDLDCPIRMHDVGIAEEDKEKILTLMNRNRASGMHIRLNEEDRSQILNMMF